jgi:Holliday junction resolvase RusA-like endonuclease
MLLVIPGNPIAKARHRSCQSFNGKIFHYDPQDKEKKNVKSFLESLILKDHNIIDKTSISDKNDHSYSVSIDFFLPYPKTNAVVRKNRIAWGLDHMNDKPDIDNLIKFYLDCANEILFPDDKQIICLNSKKLYDSNPRTEINIMKVKKTYVSDEVERILEVLPPEKFFELMELINEISICYRLFFTDKNFPNTECNPEIYRQQLTRTTGLLSKLTELGLPTFKKINKVAPDFYKKCKTVLHPEPASFGQTLC